ncbi:MAG: DNA polymerase, partial [Microcystaceae cyanobacterium]
MHELDDAVRKESCPKCGSKDNVGVWADGHKHCFTPGCGYHISVEGQESESSFDLPSKRVYDLKGRSINEATARKFGVFGSPDTRRYYFPYYIDGKLSNYKIRPHSSKNKMCFLERGRKDALFGKHCVSKKQRRLIITEGEFDALAADQMYGMRYACVSVGHGAEGAARDIQRDKEFINQYDEVVLAFDSDEPGRSATDQCKELIGWGKVRIAVFPDGFKDANDFLQRDATYEFREAIDSATTYKPAGFTDNKVLVDNLVESLRNTERMKGTSTGFKDLDKLMGGFRNGEIITVAAATSMGKSSLCLQLALNYSNNSGRKCGLFSLEMSVNQTGRWLYEMVTGKNLRDEDGRYNIPSEASIRNVMMPLYKNNFLLYDKVGNLTEESLQSAIEYAVKEENAGLILVDHKDAALCGGESEWQAIDKLYMKLKKLSMDLDICIMIVSHLSRMQGDKNAEKFSMNNLRGSQGVNHWSDVIVGIDGHREDSIRRVLVTKNRTEGRLGSFYLDYDLQQRRFIEIGENLEDEYDGTEEQLRSDNNGSESGSEVRTSETALSSIVHTGLPSDIEEREADIHRSEGTVHSEGQSQDGEGETIVSQNGHQVHVHESKQQTEQQTQDDILAVGGEIQVPMGRGSSSTTIMEGRVDGIRDVSILNGDRSSSALLDIPGNGRIDDTIFSKVLVDGGTSRSICGADIFSDDISSDSNIDQLPTDSVALAEKKQHLIVDLETIGLIDNGEFPTVLCVGIGNDSIGYSCNQDIQQLKDYVQTHRFVFHNASFDLAILHHHGVFPNEYDDTQLMAYSVSQRDLHYSLDHCARRFGCITEKQVKPWGEKQKYPTEYSEELSNYCITDVKATDELYSKLLDKFKEDKIVADHYYNIELPHQKVLMEMEKNGMLFDLKKAHEVSEELEHRLENLVAPILEKYPSIPLGKKFGKTEKAAPKEFILCEYSNDDQKFTWTYNVEPNFQSDRHRHYLLNQDGIDKFAKTTKGNVCLNKAELEKINHDYARIFLEYERLSTLRNTFLIPLAGKSDGDSYIHGSFTQTATITGRLSSRNPNLQNIPIRSEEGKLVRSLFTAPPGYKVVSGDLSNIEGRILAELLSRIGDDRLAKGFREGADLHQINSDIWGVTRSEAKTVLYLKIYGGGATKLSASLGIHISTAKKILATVDERCPKLALLQRKVGEKAMELGYTKTMFGRKVYNSEGDDHWYKMLNYKIQGTAADLLKKLINASQEIIRTYQALP